MFTRLCACLLLGGFMTACSIIEDHPDQASNSSYHEISLPQPVDDVPSRPMTQTQEERHVHHCQQFFDATLASATAKIAAHHRM